MFVFTNIWSMAPGASTHYGAESVHCAEQATTILNNLQSANYSEVRTRILCFRLELLHDLQLTKSFGKKKIVTRLGKRGH